MVRAIRHRKQKETIKQKKKNDIRNNINSCIGYFKFSSSYIQGLSIQTSSVKTFDLNLRDRYYEKNFNLISQTFRIRRVVLITTLRYSCQHYLFRYVHTMIHCTSSISECFAT